MIKDFFRKESSVRAYAFEYTTLDHTLSTASMLSQKETERMQLFGSKQRQVEFIAGRIAARRAIQKLLQCMFPKSIYESYDLSTIVISHNAAGAPIINCSDINIPVALSISHTRTRAVAIAAIGYRSVGVDLCDHVYDVPRVYRIAKKAFPHDEEQKIARENQSTIASAWALKEATAKALQIALLEGRGLERICIESITPPYVVVHENNHTLEFSILHSKQDTTAFVTVLD